jgi:hypothetical protein
MKLARILVVASICLCFAGPGYTAERIKKSGNRYTVYDTTEKCQVVCKAPKPFLACLEDGLAYLLDVPLAILSPITCPIVSPVLDRLDPVKERTYRRK